MALQTNWKVISEIWEFLFIGLLLVRELSLALGCAAAQYLANTEKYLKNCLQLEN